MKRTAKALLLITALSISILAAACFVGLAVANPSLGDSTLPETPDLSAPAIVIQVPEASGVYDAESVPYAITVEKPPSWKANGTGYMNAIGYIIDGEINVTVADANSPSVSISVEEPHSLVFTPNPDFIDLHSENQSIRLEGSLSGLAEGSHTIQVWVNSVSVYHPADIPHDFYGWWAAVAERPVATSSRIVHFSVANQATEPEPFPATLATAVSVASLKAVAVGLGLLVYLKKRNH